MVSRFWTFPAALTLALALASGAQAREDPPVITSTTGTTTITDPGGIETTGEVIFEDISLNPGTNLGPILGTSESSANITILGGDAVSLAVPETFEMVRQGGPETLTVVTSSRGDTYTAITSLDGVLRNSGTLSIDVGGSIRISASELAPGEYRGLLVVMAQYN